MAIEDSSKLIKEMNDQHEAEDYINGLLKDPAMKADMERAQLQTPEQEEVHEYFVTFMKENNNQGMELTEGDLLASFRQAKQDTGYFAGDNEPVEPTSWAQASEGLELTPQREQSAELER